MASPSSSVDPAAFAPSTSASRRADESDLDPAAFLRSVRELSEKREREDAARYEELKQEIEKSRHDRAARRAESARSISPQKRNPTAQSVPPTTPPPPTLATMDTAAPSPSADVPEFKGFASADRPKPSVPSTQTTASTSDASELASKPSPSASSLARSGTLSWQQRPSSRASTSRPRSMVAPDNTLSAPYVGTEEQEVSRGQIAASLGARDPAWFKQTADRGIGNAAYRKSAAEVDSGDSLSSSRQGLPGMRPGQSNNTPRPTSPAQSESVESDPPSYISSAPGALTSSTQFSSIRTSTSSKPDLKSLIAEDASQADASPMSDRTSSTTDGHQTGLGRTPTMSSSQARLASTIDRPTSPTKGMGGFVQSAMLKRSDSVSKRWSAQPGGSISRENSVSSGRSGYSGLAGSQSMSRLERGSDTNGSTTKPNSHSTNNLTAPSSAADDDAGSGRSSTMSSAQGRSRAITASNDDGLTSPPASPSKRWSPTKSTWLETAIIKPDSPKPILARNTQPAWMADIAKAKAQRASTAYTSKQIGESDSRPQSPAKQLFAQEVLKRSKSRDLGTPETLTPKAAKQPASASGVLPTATSEAEIVSHTKFSNDIEGPQTTNTASKAQIQPRLIPEVNDGPKSSSASSTIKLRPETSPKPQTDFRSNLRTRPQSGNKQEEVPEFLSKVGHLRRATTQNYVAPDVLKGNILRGKSDLAKTGGPVKMERRDELKESLVAKKDQWKKDKDEGIVHERKVSQPPPVTPQKPEALAKRDALGKTEGPRIAQSAEKPKNATPEALARQRSVKAKPAMQSPRPEQVKQYSAPSVIPTTDTSLVQPRKQMSTPVASSNPSVNLPTDTSKMASRFNPGLAGILARGPPTMSGGKSAPLPSTTLARTGSVGDLKESSTESAQLQDMRKGRAKGPKKRKGAAQAVEIENSPVAITAVSEQPDVSSSDLLVDTPMPKSELSEPQEAVPRKPRALPGSAASVMISSFQKTSGSSINSVTPTKPPAISSPKPLIGSPSTSIQDRTASTPNIENKTSDVSAQKMAVSNPLSSTNALSSSRAGKPSAALAGSTPIAQKAAVPEFQGFGSVRRSIPSPRLADDDKENAGDSSPSIRSTAAKWGQQPTAKKAEPPTQIKLPSKKDEEAAMRSAGLLASNGSRPGSSNGLGTSTDQSNGVKDIPPSSAGVPPKPMKSSRAVSGQLQEASPNRGTLGWFEPPKGVKGVNATEQQLRQVFGTVLKSNDPLSIDTQAVLSSSAHQERIFKTIQKSVQVVQPNGISKEVSAGEEYTFFDESVYICMHAYSVADGPRKTEMFLWSGDSSSRLAAEQAESTAKRLSKDVGSAYVHAISQGLEPAGFLQALGGMLVTRRGSHQAPSKQYLLRGRKHLGQIVFDEVDFSVKSLQSGFAYLISYPVTLQNTRMYLWKGSACSSEEVGAARLAAADLSPAQEVIEVDDGAEFASFLKIFGPDTTKADIDQPVGVWTQKALASNKFAARLFRIQAAEAKGLFSNIFTRRPSWGSGSPVRKDENQPKFTTKEISPFTQSDLEADCIYLLDAYNAVFVLVGPVFATQPEAMRNALFGQALLFASDYAMLAASIDDRPSVPKALVLLSGEPQDLKLLFRHWDEKTGFWGTGGLLAGGTDVQKRKEVSMLDLDDVLGVVCRAGR